MDIERLLDTAEAVLDSECGVKSLEELAYALYEIDPRRDYRSYYTVTTDAERNEVASRIRS